MSCFDDNWHLQKTDANDTDNVWWVCLGGCGISYSTTAVGKTYSDVGEFVSRTKIKGDSTWVGCGEPGLTVKAIYCKLCAKLITVFTDAGA